MKKLMTVFFALMIGVTLSAPAWAQNTTGGSQPQTTTATKKDTKSADKTAKTAKKNKKSSKTTTDQNKATK